MRLLLCRRRITGVLPLILTLLFWGASDARATPLNVGGVVIGPDGKPIAGATVAVAARGGYKAAKPDTQTDAAGRFRIDGDQAAEALSRPGDMSLPDGKTPVPAMVVAPGYGVVGATLTEGENTVRLERATSVSGIVKNEQGEAIADADVRLRYIQPEDELQGTAFVNLELFPSIIRLYTARTGADGRWTLGGLPLQGTAQVELDDARFVRATQQIPLSATPVQALPLTAKPGAGIAGRVLLGDGQPAANFAILANMVAGQNRGGGGYASGKTGPDGSYTLYGLPEGSYKVQATDPQGEWVTAGLDSFTTRPGQPVAAPDIAMQRGVVLEGMVIDDETEEPVAGATLTAEGMHGSSASTPSDAQGRYTVRVLPGTLRLYFSTTPAGYVRENFVGNSINIAATQKTIPPRRLKKGLTIRGTAVDEAGKPAVGAIIRLGQSYMRSQAKVGDKGNWVVGGINPEPERMEQDRDAGVLKLSTVGEWQIVRPEIVILPVERPVEVVLRHIKLSELEGRVVTPQGEPVAGAQVRLKISLDDRSAGGWANRVKTTDEQGRYHTSQLRPENVVSVAVSKPGFVFVRGGIVARGQTDEVAGGVWHAEDVVLAPMVAEVAGQIVDANGAPVPEARVTIAGTAVGGNSVAMPIRADAQGRFAFKNLAEGEVKLLAAHDRDFGASPATTGREAKVVVLPRDEAKGEDVARASELIAQWTREDDEREKKSPRARNQWRPDSARNLVRLLAGRDPDLALRLGSGPDGKVTDDVLGTIVMVLAARDPKRAAAWAPPLVEPMQPGYMRDATIGELALAVVEVDATLARRLMEGEAAKLQPKDFSSEAAIRYAYLAAIASKLKDPRADVWVQSLQVALEQSATNERQSWMAGYTIQLLSKGSIELAEKLVNTLEPVARMRALENLVSGLARTDMPAARRLLGTMEALALRPELQAVEQKNDGMYRPTARQSLENAYDNVVAALAPVEPQAALELARKISGEERPQMRSLAIATAARHLQGDEATRAFREALAVQRGYVNRDTTSMIAALAYAHDPALGAELFEAARKNFAPRDNPGDDEGQLVSGAAYAFYHAPIDPAESRLSLETEWAQRMTAYERTKNNSGADRGYSDANQNLGLIADAMVALDLERAVQMAGEVGALGNSYSDPRGFIVAYLLAPAAKRRTMRFEQYYRDELE